MVSVEETEIPSSVMVLLEEMSSVDGDHTMEGSGSPKAEQVRVALSVSFNVNATSASGSVKLTGTVQCMGEEVNESEFARVVISIPWTCTVILAMLGGAEPPLELSPMHSYTPS